MSALNIKRRHFLMLIFFGTFSLNAIPVNFPYPFNVLTMTMRPLHFIIFQDKLQNIPFIIHLIKTNFSKIFQEKYVYI